MTYLVAAYGRTYCFGGPEEGGWWFDAGVLVRVMKVTRNQDKALDYCRRLNTKLRSRVFGPNAGKHEYSSVLSEGEVLAEVHEGMCPLSYPETKPHYE